MQDRTGRNIDPQARIRAVSADLRARHGERVQRLLVRGGFGCPNRDGRAGTGGCLYCDPTATRANDGLATDAPVSAQLAAARQSVGSRTGARRFMAYFHDGSATDAPVARLERLYRAALAAPDVVGLAVGTRPDCVPDPVLDLLAELGRETDLWLELGLQSASAATLARLNRGHDVDCFVDAVERAQARGLQVAAHVILGLPGEGRSDARVTAALLARLDVAGVKLHQFHVLAGAPWAAEFRAGRLPVPTLAGYASLAADLIERIPPSVVLHRLAATARPEHLLAPDWTARRGVGHAAVLAELARRETWQGRRLGAERRELQAPRREGRHADRLSCAS